ncbi:hypothetical protein Dpep_1436 [Dethiosulfovibrio peptidovorans DSM 11002]|uniref:Uncharacterized protein n=1 Tax=Dethiosulfovibrio peptidovorans DSM 11002 TaxID=469381 RepID=D2Z7L5_9BACT|nr:hypothetical protein Dpep_1436 [Dethiosulfovibrio peptidovorans DSM 11002]
MFRFVVKRIGQLFLVLFAVSIIVFVFTSVMGKVLSSMFRTLIFDSAGPYRAMFGF